jgi:hypothetical protein
MNFGDFWVWLRRTKRAIQNLGGRKYNGKPRAFTIRAGENGGACTPRSTGKEHSFTKDQAKAVWDLYQSLLTGERHDAGRYVDGPKKHNWNPCPQPRYCNPWIAAAIRDFLSGRP